jgi:L-lactate dehydrogenase complex protein LldE
MRIAMFATCLADAMFPQAAIATVTLLERLGQQVSFPGRQTCCGRMHINTGYFGEATALVRHHVEALEDAECDAIVPPSGSCVGSVRHQHAMVARRAGDENPAARATAIASRTYELSELLVATNMRSTGLIGTAAVLNVPVSRRVSLPERRDRGRTAPGIARRRRPGVR